MLETHGRSGSKVIVFRPMNFHRRGAKRDFESPTVRGDIFVLRFPEAPVLWGEVSAYQMEPLGGNVILSCDARGDPVPSINWNKDGSPLTVSNRIRQMNNGSLAIYRTVVSQVPEPTVREASLKIFLLLVVLSYSFLSSFFL